MSDLQEIGAQVSAIAGEASSWAQQLHAKAAHLRQAASRAAQMAQRSEGGAGAMQAAKSLELAGRRCDEAAQHLMAGKAAAEQFVTMHVGAGGGSGPGLGSFGGADGGSGESGGLGGGGATGETTGTSSVGGATVIGGAMAATSPAMTSEMEDGLTSYSGETGSVLNRALRESGGMPSSEAAKLTSSIDAAFSVAPTSSSDTVLNRSVGFEFLESLGCGGLSVEETAAKLNMGPAMVDNGFLSTSTGRPEAFARKPVQLSVEVPAGSRYINMRWARSDGTGSLSVLPDEMEILLPRNGKLSVVPGSAKPRADGGWAVKLRYREGWNGY